MTAAPHMAEALTDADMDALQERLRDEYGCCPFCRRDPYEYVDIGVGMERVAVSCCDLGIALFQYGDEQLAAEVALRREANDAITAIRARLAAALPAPDEKDAEIARLREALAGIASMTDPDDPDSYRSDDREGCLDAAHARARAALTT